VSVRILYRRIALYNPSLSSCSSVCLFGTCGVCSVTAVSRLRMDGIQLVCANNHQTDLDRTQT